MYPACVRLRRLDSACLQACAHSIDHAVSLSPLHELSARLQDKKGKAGASAQNPEKEQQADNGAAKVTSDTAIKRARPDEAEQEAGAGKRSNTSAK